MPARRDEGPLADEPLNDDIRILRRIPPHGVHPRDPSKRPISLSFKPRKNEAELSVDVWEAGNTPVDTIQRATNVLPEGEEYGVVSMTVGDVRELRLDVVRNRQPDNPFHALISGPFTNSIPTKLSKKAASGWIKKPVPEK